MFKPTVPKKHQVTLHSFTMTDILSQLLPSGPRIGNCKIT